MVEFYITNVCNLTCRGCNRFNDGKFKGHQRWNDHADAYEKWSEILDIDFICIIGGEPSLNPDLELYVSNLRKFWPNSTIMIQTNGTYTNIQQVDWYGKYQTSFGVSIHDKESADQLKKDWKDNGTIIEAYVFNQPNIIKKDDHYILHDSDPDLAFKACDMKHCHTMFNGKLYKCPMMPIIPEFAKQFDLQTTDTQQELLDNYQPLTCESTQEELENFVDNINTLIPQCSLCKEKHVWSTALGPVKTNLPPPKFD